MIPEEACPRRLYNVVIYSNMSAIWFSGSGLDRYLTYKGSVPCPDLVTDAETLPHKINFHG
jgi:hypothetical protein